MSASNRAASKTALIVVMAIAVVVAGALIVVLVNSAMVGNAGAVQTADGGTPAETLARQIHVYDVRGEIASMPTEENPEISIRHEEIPDFVNAEGEIVGMRAMTMSFPLAEGVDLSGFEAGDGVLFTFETWWTPDPQWQLTKIAHDAGP